MKKRCAWVEGKPDLYLKYHDEEWGTASRDEAYLYELFLLECFQAGLSWWIILKKREAFRQAFDGFDVHKIANYDETKIEQLLQNEAIIRSKGKIGAAVHNAKCVLNIMEEYGSFSKYLWGFTNNQVIHNVDNEFRTTSELSDRMSKDMKKRGMKYVGSVTIYSFLQAAGIVDDHEAGCFKHKNDISIINH